MRRRRQDRTPEEETETAAGKLPFLVVGLGASAGGLEALQSFFENVPADPGMSFVVIVHLAPDHVSLLPELLQKKTRLPVESAADGVTLEANRVYVIPPNSEMTIAGGVLHVAKSVPGRGLRLPIDGFLRSLAEECGPGAVSVIFSGTGSDGGLGIRAVKGHGGLVVVQDPQSAAYDGMPASALATGLADLVLPPSQIPARLVEYSHHDSRNHGLAANGVEEAIRDALGTLLSNTGHDFSIYKENTIRRRLERRMKVHALGDTSEYLRYLRGNDRELQILFRELLIGVTRFFRDPPAFERLQAEFLPALLGEKPADSAVRVWVPGCSTGEEAYSIGIVLREALEALHQERPVQIFATDIDEHAIEVARAGVYPEAIAADVTPARLERHFDKEPDGTYRIKPSVRGMVVFAAQSVTEDPPFTKLDVLCCRNLLIYLRKEVQSKLLSMFGYSLREGGILFLGSSESVGGAGDRFSALDRKWRIFRRNPAAAMAQRELDFPAIPVASLHSRSQEPANERSSSVSTVRILETMLQDSALPPSVVINKNAEVVYVHGRTGRFLEPAPGEPTGSILAMARPGLRAELSSAIFEAANRHTEVVRERVRIRHGERYEWAGFRVRPLTGSAGDGRLMIVVFEEASRGEKGRPRAEEKTLTPEEMESRLEETKETLHVTIEELETANEELRSTNEELQSTNEELQSTNEELETSREELQSLNEEATSANAELQSRIDELTLINDDMRNLLDSTDVAVIFLDTELQVRRFTPRATDIIPLTTVDRGRPLEHFSSQLVGSELAVLARGTLEDLETRESDAVTRAGRHLHVRVRPYRTTNNVVDGVVITFQDVTALRSALLEATGADEPGDGARSG